MRRMLLPNNEYININIISHLVEYFIILLLAQVGVDYNQ